MTSSKVKDKLRTSNKTSEKDSVEKPLRKSLWLLVACLSVLLLIATAMLMRRQNTECEKLLDGARIHFERALLNPTDAGHWLEVQNASEPLRQYIAEEGSRLETARLYFCASLCVKEFRTSHLSVTERHELQQLAEQLDLGSCDTSDLLTAGRIVLFARAFSIVDFIVEEILGRDVEVKERTTVLEFAIEVCQAQKNENDLLALCKELVDLAPNDVRPWLLIADSYESRGYRLQLTEVYPEIINRSPQHAIEYRRRLARRYIEIGETEKARVLLEELKRDSPAVMAEDPVLEAQLLHLEGRLVEAEQRLRSALGDESDNVDAAVLLGQILMSREQATEVIQLLEPFAERYRTNAPLQFLLGNARSFLGNEDAAYEYLALHHELKVARLKINVINDFLVKNPPTAALAGELAWSYAKIGKTDEARKWEQAAQRLRAAEAP